MSQLSAEEVRSQLSVRDGLDPSLSVVVEQVASTQALVSGHFSLHDGRHTAYALRFRAFARDARALERAAHALCAAARWPWDDVTIVSPDTAGFVLGDEVRRQVKRPHAVVQTDLSRRPSRRLLTGTIATRKAVIVNDVSVTGDSLQSMRDLIVDRGATLVGVMVFAAVDPTAFVKSCYDLGAGATHLLDAGWSPCASGRSSCAGCKRDEPLIPIAEFA